VARKLGFNFARLTRWATPASRSWEVLGSCSPILGSSVHFWQVLCMQSAAGEGVQGLGVSREPPIC
jgi:hypothetical protein